MYSVIFDRKNGRDYYKGSDNKYHLENEDALLDRIPQPLDFDKKPYYYWQDKEWIFDNDAYEQAKQQEIDLPNIQETITTEELLAALLEIAENISDIEDALIELAEMEG